MRGESTFAGHLGTFSPTLLYLSVHGGLIAAGLVSLAMHKTRRLLGFAKRLLFSGARRSCSRRRVEKRKRVKKSGLLGSPGTKPKIDVSTKRAAATFFGNSGEKLGAAQTAAAFVFYDISFVFGG